MTLKEVVWIGDSKEAVSEFPTAIREDMGFQLYQLQQGKMPTRSRPMKSIGGSVFEEKRARPSGLVQDNLRDPGEWQNLCSSLF